MAPGWPRSSELAILQPVILDRHPDAPTTDEDDDPDGLRDLRAIGYWMQPIACDVKNGRVPEDAPWLEEARLSPYLGWHLPDPYDFMDPSWDATERATVVAYLRAGQLQVVWYGISKCRFRCGEQDMGAACLSDGTYVWPEGFAHYLEKHAVRPPEEFVLHVLRKTQERVMG